MLYQRVNLASVTVDGPAGPLPPELVGLDDATLADLPAALDPVPEAFAGAGYWPVELTDPVYDPATEILTDGVTNRQAVNSRKVVTAKRTKRALTPEELIPPPTTPVLYAAARLAIDGFDVTGIGVNSRLSGAFLLDVGKICVLFAEPLPDTSYMVNCNDGQLCVQVFDEDKAQDLFVITVTNAAGEPTDAEFVNIIIVRAS